MPGEQEQLFASVDALLESVAAQEDLPEPAERRRLREAAGLSQDQVARALGARRETVTAWESGRKDPRPPRRAAYVRLLEGLAARYPAPEDPSERAAAEEPVAVTPLTPPDTVPPAATGTAGAPAAPTPEARIPAPAPEPASTPAAEVGPSAPAPEAPPAPAGRPAAAATDTARPAASGRRPAGRSAPKPAPDTPVAADPRFVHGPLGVLDGDGSLYCAGGLVLDCPARTVPDLVAWTLAEARLGAVRLHRNGKDSDPLIVLTAPAAARLGLPEELADRRSMRLPADHPVVRQIAKARWQLTKRGFGPWARVYRAAQGGQRSCVQLAVLPWDALDARAWGSAGRLPPAELARTLTVYASRVLTPRGSTAVAGLELMTALRPPTRAVKDEAAGTWVPGPVPGSLTEPVDPAPPEAPDEHPVVAALFPRHHRRTPEEILDEEAYDWIRPPDLLTDAEYGRPYAVGIDVNTAFLAAANRLVVGHGAPVHVTAPAFDKQVAGSWLVDLSGIELDPRLPSPFTPHGERPTGPAWYATPTVAYAAEIVEAHRLPVAVTPIEAYLRTSAGPYLDPWYGRLAEAYKATMADLGVTAGMSPQDFLAAMRTHKQADPGMAAVLSAVKATVKGGIGKLRERPQGAQYRPGERWSALERPTWRPDIRAAVISAARVNMHRKILRTALATQSSPPPSGHLTLADDAVLPIALLSDGAVYAAAGESPLDVLPYGADGKPAPGTFRLGVSPGMVKHEGTRPLYWAVELLEQALNPARHIKEGAGAEDEGE